MSNTEKEGLSMQPPNQWQPMPQQPMYPQQPAPKKSRKGLWIGLGVIVLAIALCGVIASSLAKSTPSTDTTSVTSTGQQATHPANTPAHTAKWTTTRTFSGNGSKKTATFSVPDDWKIIWKCDHSSFQGLDYNMIIMVYNSDGSLADSGVNTTCKSNYTHDETEIHTAGTVYLDITSEGAWSIQVQELK